MKFFAEKLEYLVKNAPVKELKIPKSNLKFNKNLILSNLVQRQKSIIVKLAVVGFLGYVFVPWLLNAVQTRFTESIGISQLRAQQEHEQLRQSTLLNLYATQYPGRCAGNQHPICQTTIKDAFSSAVAKNDMFSAEGIALACVGHEDESCQQIIRRAFSELASEKYFRAEAFAIACIDKTDKSSKEVVRTAFSRLIVTKPSAAVRFAIACLGKPDENCQATVRSALPMLLEKDQFGGAEDLALASISKTPKDATCIAEIYKTFKMLLTKSKPYCASEFLANCPVQEPLDKNVFIELFDEHC